jgi:hypothetical protein
MHPSGVQTPRGAPSPLYKIHNLSPQERMARSLESIDCSCSPLARTRNLARTHPGKNTANASKFSPQRRVNEEGELKFPRWDVVNGKGLAMLRNGSHGKGLHIFEVAKWQMRLLMESGSKRM